MKYLTLFFAVLFNWFTLGLICFVLAIQIAISYYGKDLPSSYEITNYKPILVTKVFDDKGNIVDNFYNEKRVFLPYNEIPQSLIHAFISAEDKNFFSHKGYDPISLLKAFYDAFNGKRMRGASTITQQVMKNFLLTNERSVTRKIKELILAFRLEKNMTKDKILEVYLNEIYLGQGTYGILAASYKYFGKSVYDLTISENAFLASLPKAPNRYHPVKNKQAATTRRNFVLKEMYENGFINKNEYMNEKKEVLSSFIDKKNKNVLKQGIETNRSYFSSEIRRQMLNIVSKENFYNDGFIIKTSLNKKLQNFVKEELQKELINYDIKKGIFYGPVNKIQTSLDPFNLELKVENLNLPEIKPSWKKAVLLDKQNNNLIIKVLNTPLDKNINFLNSSWVKFYIENNVKKKSTNPGDFLSVGDIIYVEKSIDKKGFWDLRQIPKIQGSLIVMEANSGRVLALQGGFSYEDSFYNRATQARRQPGSLFKPFVYAAALENGYHPTSIIVDAPINFETSKGIWSPKNASNNWLGVAPLRKGLELSKNLMTIRLANEIGINEVAKYANIFNLYDNMPNLLSYSIGAGETTLLKLVSAYSSFANGGYEVEYSFIDRVQNYKGETIFQKDYLECQNCNSVNGNIIFPVIKSKNKRILDPLTVYRINSMLQGVVKRGTASQTVGKLNFEIAGKTGTTNKAKDAWFIGYTPDLVIGCYIGYDKPTPLGDDASGGKLCGDPVSRLFKKILIKKVNWKKPKNTIEVLVNMDTGIRVEDDQKEENTIYELFRKGQEPKIGETANLIDGGFSMGQDLLQLDKQKDKDLEENDYNRPTAGGLLSGDLY